MKYCNINTGEIYYSGNTMTRRINSTGVFSGIPTLAMLEDWGFTQVIEDTKEQTRAAKLDALDQYTSNKSFVIYGKSIWVDDATRQRLRISLDAYNSMNIDIATKWFDGVEYTFSVQDWYDMMAAVEVYASDFDNNIERHRAAINALQTEQEIEDYDFTTGYPQPLRFLTND